MDHCKRRTPVNHRTVQRPVTERRQIRVSLLRICDGGPQCLPSVNLAVSGRHKEGRASAPLRLDWSEEAFSKV